MCAIFDSGYLQSFAVIKVAYTLHNHTALWKTQCAGFWYTLHPEHCILNATPYTLNPEAYTLQGGGERGVTLEP